MSSVLAKQAEIDPYTKFMNITTPCYYENNVECDIPIPFTVVNNVLDINTWSSAINTFVNDGTYQNNYSYTRVKPMGGLSKIDSLGTNMLNYLSNMTSNWEGESTSNVQMYISPAMTRIQTSADQYTDDQPLAYSSPINFHPSLPSGTDYVFYGDSNNNYLSSWIFQTPLTVSYQYGPGITRYVTFKSIFNAN
jgi:hypothetical protein